MAKALIYGMNCINGKPTKFVPFYWESEDRQSFCNARDYKTLESCESFLRKRNYNEIEYDIEEKKY